MKKTVFTLTFIGLAFCGYSQNEAKPNLLDNPKAPAISGYLKDYLGNDHNMLRSPITQDYLKNYQDKNKIHKFTLPCVGMDDVKKTAKNLENIDNMIVIKPNLAAIIKMPIIKPDDTVNHTLIITNEKINQSKPLE